MKYYELTVLCSTEDSFRWHELNNEKSALTKEMEPPNNLLEKRRLCLEINDISNFYPDRNRNVTTIEVKSGKSFSVVISYDNFKKMIHEKDYWDSEA